MSIFFKGYKMRVDIQKLKGRMAEKGKTIVLMSEHCGMSRGTFAVKMHGGGVRFTLGEVFAVCAVLDLDGEAARDIFMAEDEYDVNRYIL
jgi:hypothetical protein